MYPVFAFACLLQVNAGDLVDKLFDLGSRTADAYRFLDMPLRRYLIQYLGGSLIITLVMTFLGVFIAEIQVLAWMMYALAVFAPTVVLVYPLMLRERERRQIDENFHLFITHITVLALTNTDRIEIFREIAKEEDYGALATEMGRLVAYIDTFNMSLDDAARLRANETPSDLLSNFYEKLAYSVGAGQSLSSFLYSEQEDVREMYATEYESRLERLETIAELFLSTSTTMAFLFVFAMLMPLLTGSSPLLILGGVVFLYVIVQIMFLMLMATIAPRDELWYFPEEGYSRKQVMVWASLVIGFLGMLVFSVFTLLIANRIPIHFYPIIPTIPLIVPAVTFWRLERGMRDAEDQYPGFIRGLGSIEGVKQTSTEDVLETLKDKDFGALSKNIRQLYRRLFLSINTRLSWDRFAAEVGSNLIKRFTDMFVLGREMGGDPAKLGNIVSANFRKVHQLRQKRKTMKRKIAGMMYGTTMATSFTFFASYEILKVMVDLGREVEEAEMSASILHAAVYDMGIVEIALFLTIIFNCLAVAVLIRKIGRMHLGGASLHVMLLIWLNFLTGYFVHHMAADIITV